MLAGSLVSLYYYLVILKTILVDDTTGDFFTIRLDAKQRLCIALIGAAVVLLGIFPDALLSQILGAMR